jgi:cell division protein FtsL
MTEVLAKPQAELRRVGRGMGAESGRGALAATVLALAVMASALAVVYTKHLNRKLFVELQALQASRDMMNIEWGQLQLEQGTLATHSRIEEHARARLGMGLPAPAAVVIVRPK